MKITLYIKYIIGSLLIKDKDSFFSNGYKYLYPECKSSGLTPWQHYVMYGKKKGYDNGNHPATEFFFREGYEIEYPNIKSNNANAWHEYINEGLAEGHDNGMNPSDDVFLAPGYLEMYPDVAESGLDPWRHYVLNGKNEGRDNGNHPDDDIFFAAGYLEMYPDVAESGLDPWRNYVLSGKNEGRDNGTHPGEDIFFAAGYLEMYPDVAESGEDSWRNYVLSGKNEGRDNGNHPGEDMFFAAGYLEMYPDVAESGLDPWRHYVLNGKNEGRDNGKHPGDDIFFAAGYLEMYPDIAESGLDPWWHYVISGKKEGRSNAVSRCKKTSDLGSYSEWILNLHENKSNFLENDGRIYRRSQNDPKIFAYYLPQFHAIPVNDKNFGKGFTEWTNVSRSTPLFLGHIQPRVPYDLAFYNLENISVIERQVTLAKQYGLYGFCFYYYWFSGKKVLDRPLKLFLDSKIDFKFHLMWANENWSKLWDGGNKNIILEQKFDESQIDDFYHDLLPYIKDDRYEKINNKPILAVYRVSMFTEKLFRKFVNSLNELAIKDGFDGFYFLGTNSFCFSEPQKYNLKGLIEFPPHGLIGSPGIRAVTTDLEWFNLKAKFNVYDIHDWIKDKGYIKKEKFSVFRCCFPGWDNSPRKAYSDGSVFMMQPDDFYSWLSGIIRWTKANHKDNERYIYINAWNEWGEGAFLEPDIRCGYNSLFNLRRALEDNR
jgi:hypothetical protein